MLSFALALATSILTAPPGVVPFTADQFAEPWRIDAALPRAAVCSAADPSADGAPIDSCDVDVGVVGFHPDGRVAVLQSPLVGGCGDEITPKLSLRVGTNAAKGGKVTRFFERGGWSSDFTRTWKALAGLANDGFVAPADLRATVVQQPSGIRAHDPAARLAAPLEGWVVYAAEERGGIVLRLVAPDNRTAHVIGRGPVANDCTREAAAEGMCGAHSDPSIRQVVLSPDQARLVVTYTTSDGSHCGSDPSYVIDWKLPKNLVP